MCSIVSIYTQWISKLYIIYTQWISIVFMFYAYTFIYYCCTDIRIYLQVLPLPRLFSYESFFLQSSGLSPFPPSFRGERKHPSPSVFNGPLAELGQLVVTHKDKITVALTPGLDRLLFTNGRRSSKMASIPLLYGTRVARSLTGLH